MQPKLSFPDFEALVRRAGLSLSNTQLVEIHAAWAYVEPMLERIRSHGRGREAEPALTFDPTAFGTEAK